MNKAKVSIIVPVYNTEAYLERCVTSLVNQTYSNLEILLIDDGSKDGSLKMCEKLSQTDSRIRVFHKENEGLGITRNFGLKNLTGDYVVFADSDDYLPLDAVDIMVAKALETESDVVVCGYFYNDSVVDVPLPEKTYDQSEIMSILLPHMMGDYGGSKDLFTYSACWRIFSKKIIVENNIEFKSEREYIWEDLVFSLDLYPKCRKVTLLNVPVYHYCFNQNSLTHVYRPDKFEKIIFLYSYIKKKIEKLQLNSDAYIRLDTNFLGHIITCLKLECFYKSDNGRRVAFRNIDTICNNSTVQEMIKEYPRELYNKSRRIYCFMIRHKIVLGVYILTCFQNARKKIM